MSIYYIPDPKYPGIKEKVDEHCPECGKDLHGLYWDTMGGYMHGHHKKGEEDENRNSNK